MAGGEGSEDDGCEVDGEDLAVELFDLEYQYLITDTSKCVRFGKTHLTPRLLYLAIAVLSFVSNCSLSNCPKDIVLPVLLRFG